MRGNRRVTCEVPSIPNKRKWLKQESKQEEVLVAEGTLLDFLLTINVLLKVEMPSERAAVAIDHEEAIAVIFSEFLALLLCWSKIGRHFSTQP